MPDDRDGAAAAGGTTRSFWVSLASAVLVGGLSGLAALLFVVLVSAGTQALWGTPHLVGLGSGPWWWVAAGAVAGLAVGALRRLLRVPDQLGGPIGILTTGSVDARSAPAAVLVSLTSLVGGASMGPFDAGIRSGAAIGAWWSRNDQDEDRRQRAVLNGAAGGLGGLLTAPVIATVLIGELHRRRYRDYLAYVIPNLAAAVTGFTVFYLTVGSTFLGIYVQQSYTVHIWHFAVAALLGLVAAGASWLLEHAVAAAAGLSARWVPSLPVRCALGGAVFGLVAVILPPTFGSGKQQLALLVDQPQALGVGLLLAIAAGKVVAMAASLGTGFIGGPVMPTLFLGGTLGLAAAAAMPSVPQSLVFSCMLVGVAGTALRAPVSMAVLVVLVTGLGPVEATPAVIATVVAYVARRGVGVATLANPPVDLPPASGRTTST